ncbi:HNH endonuclease [Faunimonas pinastri]|nr:HNH endonuclease [Faunimonas pinastri]
MEGKKWVYRRVKPSLHRKTERLYFTMTFDGISKSVLVNRVIGLALIPNPDNLPEVNHKSGDKTDNSVGNLEWASRSDQEKHAFAHGLKATRGTANGNSKLTPDDVIAIRQSDATVTDLAMKHGVSRGTISDIREERTWRHV